MYGFIASLELLHTKIISPMMPPNECNCMVLHVMHIPLMKTSTYENYLVKQYQSILK